MLICHCSNFSCCCEYIRSIVVLDDIFCIFVGTLANIADLRHHYGLPRQATEAMIVVEAYKALRDRAPYPPDQVVKHLDGKFAFIIFDAKTNTLFVSRVSYNENWLPFLLMLNKLGEKEESFLLSKPRASVFMLYCCLIEPSYLEALLFLDTLFVLVLSF